MSKTSEAQKIEFAKSEKARFKDVPLEWPLMVDGVKLSHVTVRRLKAKEVAALQEGMQGGGIAEVDLVAMFTDQPAEVVGELDQDDLVDIKEVVFGFLPRTVREALEAEIKTAELQAGEPLQPTSPTPSNGAEKTS